MPKNKPQSTDDNWICPHCGPVKPTQSYYSEPMQADCPKCHLRLESSEGIKVLSFEEARKKRPWMYKGYEEKNKDEE